MKTIRQIAEDNFKGSNESRSEIAKMRQAYISSMPDVISADHIHPLDRVGRFTIANDMWVWCDKSAREALLNDEHPHVQSAARISSFKKA